MSFRDLSTLAGSPYDGFRGLPQIDFRRAGRILCLGVLAEPENRSWCGPKLECELGFVQQSTGFPFFSWLRWVCSYLRRRRPLLPVAPVPLRPLTSFRVPRRAPYRLLGSQVAISCRRLLAQIATPARPRVHPGPICRGCHPARATVVQQVSRLARGSFLGVVIPGLILI